MFTGLRHCTSHLETLAKVKLTADRIVNEEIFRALALDPAFETFLAARDAIKPQLEDLATFLRRYADGLDVSPAVRDYLGLSGMNRTVWQFVDASKVPDGPWKQVVTTSQISWQ